MDKFYADKMSLRLKGDHNIVHDHTHPISNDIWFKLYTMDISYFSGKFEAYMRYKNIPFERIEPHSSEHEMILAKNTGSEQLPQLYDCREAIPIDKRWMRDTTPMIEYLERDIMISDNSLQFYLNAKFKDFSNFYLKIIVMNFCGDLLCFGDGNQNLIEKLWD